MSGRTQPSKQWSAKVLYIAQVRKDVIISGSVAPKAMSTPLPLRFAKPEIFGVCSTHCKPFAICLMLLWPAVADVGWRGRPCYVYMWTSRRISEKAQKARKFFWRVVLRRSSLVCFHIRDEIRHGISDTPQSIPTALPRLDPQSLLQNRLSCECFTYSGHFQGILMQFVPSWRPKIS